MKEPDEIVAATIRDIHTHRRLRAKYIREFRVLWQDWRTWKVSREYRRKCLKEYLREECPYGSREPVRLSPRSLKVRANHLFRFACTTWRSRDTEYYSACGHDDYQSERRESALKEARALILVRRHMLMHASLHCQPPLPSIWKSQHRSRATVH